MIGKPELCARENTVISLLELVADDAVLACEQEVTRAFAAVNSAPADADKTDLLRQLKDAQDAVAAMRADRERERCARA